MGLSPFRPSSCSATKAVGNPDPKRFSILRVYSKGHVLATEVQYPDATNYEGRKIMIYFCSEELLRKQEKLDPHFCDDGSHLSPFARFAPTVAGWEVAVTLVDWLAGVV